NGREAGPLVVGSVDARGLPGEEPSRSGSQRLKTNAPHAVIVHVPEPERGLTLVRDSLLRPAGMTEVVLVLDPIGHHVRVDRAPAGAAQYFRRGRANADEDDLPVGVVDACVDAQAVGKSDRVRLDVEELDAYGTAGPSGRRHGLSVRIPRE